MHQAAVFRAMPHFECALYESVPGGAAGRWQPRHMELGVKPHRGLETEVIVKRKYEELIQCQKT